MCVGGGEFPELLDYNIENIQFSTKLTTLTKKQKGMAHSQEKKKVTEIIPEEA